MAAETAFCWRRFSLLRKINNLNLLEESPDCLFLGLKWWPFIKIWRHSIYIFKQDSQYKWANASPYVCCKSSWNDKRALGFVVLLAAVAYFRVCKQDNFSMKGLLPLWQWQGSFFLTYSQCQTPSTSTELLHLFGLTVTLLTSCSGYRLLLGSLLILRKTCSFYTNWQHYQLKGFLLNSKTFMMFLLFAFWWLFFVVPSSKWDTCY